MKPINFTITVCLFFGFIVCAHHAFGQIADYQYNRRFKVAVKQAKEATQRGEYKEAAEAWRRAYTYSEDPIFYFGIAQSYQKASEDILARKYYHLFVDQLPSDERVPIAQRELRSIESRLKDQYRTVTIKTEPSGAEIYIDKKANGSQGVAPVSVQMLPGVHTIYAVLEDHVEYVDEFKVRAGSDVNLSLTLDPEELTAPLMFKINVIGAKVYIDQRFRGKTPFIDPILVREGTREVRILRPGYRPWIQSIEVKAFTPANIDVRLEKTQGLSQGSMDLFLDTKKSKKTTKPVQWGPMISMGLGGLLLAGSTYTGVSALRLYSQLEDQVQEQVVLNPEDLNIGSSLVGTTNILIGLGVTSLIVGGTWWVLDHQKSNKVKRVKDVSRSQLKASQLHTSSLNEGYTTSMYEEYP